MTDIYRLPSISRRIAALSALSLLALGAACSKPVDASDPAYSKHLVGLTASERFDLDYAGGHASAGSGTALTRQNCLENTTFDPNPELNSEEGYMVTPSNPRLTSTGLLEVPSSSDGKDILIFTGFDDPQSILQPENYHTREVLAARGCDPTDNQLAVTY